MKVLDTVILGMKKIQVILKMLEETLKWHWKMIILIAMCGFVYWVFTLPPIEPTKEVTFPDYTDSAVYQEYYDSSLEEAYDTNLYYNDGTYR